MRTIIIFLQLINAVHQRPCLLDAIRIRLNGRELRLHRLRRCKADGRRRNQESGTDRHTANLLEHEISSPTI